MTFNFHPFFKPSCFYFVASLLNAGFFVSNTADAAILAGFGGAAAGPMCEAARPLVRSVHRLSSQPERRPAVIEFRHRSLDEFIGMEYLSGLNIATEGPNCWSAALLSAGILTEPRYVSKPEFWFWMNSRYCHALSENDRPARGDIGSLFWPAAGHFHSFVRLNKDFVFSKNSPKPEHKYAVQRYEDMFYPEFQEMSSNCKGSEKDLIDHKCAIEVVYHRCRPLPSDFVSRFSEFRDAERRLARAEHELSRWNAGTGKNKQKIFEDTVFRLGDLLEILRSDVFDGEKEFARQALEYRTIGLLLTHLPAAPALSSAAREVSLRAYDIQNEEREILPAHSDEVMR